VLFLLITMLSWTWNTLCQKRFETIPFLSLKMP
jgi:hypothetical protein